MKKSIFKLINQDMNFGELNMCNNEKVEYSCKIKTASSELFYIQKPVIFHYFTLELSENL